MTSHWSLRDKFPQVSRTLLSILANFSNAVVWMVSTRPLIFKSSSPFTKPLVTVPRDRLQLVKTSLSCSTFFFQFPSKVLVLIFLFTFFQFYAVVSRDSKFGKLSFFFFFFLMIIITRSDRLAEIRWSVCISKSQRSLCVFFSRIDPGSCSYYLFVYSNFHFLHNFQWINLSTRSYTFYVLVCYVRVLCDWSLCLYHHIAYIWCFIASYLFSL